MNVLIAMGSLVLGAFVWSFAEYALHNWMGHLGKGKNDFSREHLKHHADEHYYTPTSWKIAATTRAMLLVVPLSLWIFGYLNGALFSLGFLMGYIAYEVMHRRIHTHPPRGFYSRWARRHHYFHHYKGPKFNHGVTSPIWDVVFRTYRKPGRIRVPEKHVMSWLCDPSTGEVWPYLQEDYEVRRRKGHVGRDNSGHATQNGPNTAGPECKGAMPQTA